MWTRRQLKEKGKRALHFNYWKTVFVALVLAFILGGASGGGGAAGGLASGAASGASHNVYEGTTEQSGDELNLDEFLDEQEESLYNDDINNPPVNVPEIPIGENVISGAMIMMIVLVAIVVITLIIIIAMLIQAFLLNPLGVGGNRFFFRNLNAPAEIKELAFAYDHGYRNTVKVMFFRDLYTLLWALLFIIPGIIKAYEYRMIPYLLAENPNMPKEEAFGRSKAMMRGQKWKAFVLDLSFIGWEILSIMTLGILHIFYVGPYRRMTEAALYEALAYGNQPEEPVTPPVQGFIPEQTNL